MRLVLGNSTGRFERHGQKADFAYTPAALLEAANALLKLRFFDLPSELRPLPSLVLRPDGSVGTLMSSQTDVGSTEVCVALAEARHCVRYGRDAPAELEGWVKLQLAQAPALAPK